MVMKCIGKNNLFPLNLVRGYKAQASKGKLPSVLYTIFIIIPVLAMSRDTTINDIFKC